MHESERLTVLVNLGKKLRESRKAVGVSQEFLAARAGLHRSYVADIERGARNASVISIARLAVALGISISALCEGIDERAKRTSASVNRIGSYGSAISELKLRA